MTTVRWWKNGDHPEDGSNFEQVERHGVLITTLSEGKVVKQWDGNENPDELCPMCSAPFDIHGRIGGPKTGTIVHPGDYVESTSGSYKVKRINPHDQARG